MTQGVPHENRCEVEIHVLKQEKTLAYWNYREELSHADKLRRSYYELLRDELDQFLLQYALIDSYKTFSAHQIPFPFVEKREMKPRGRIIVTK